MSKVIEAADAMRKAWDSLKEIVNPVSATIDFESAWVHVKSLRDLEQIPGEVEIKELQRGSYYAAQVSKELLGVEFRCYLTADEYQAAIMAASA